MGKKRGKSRKGSKAERDSEEEESATSQMSGTSSEKRRFAETREELREANRETEALRMAAAHETPTETPNIYGPGNIFDTDDDDDDDGDEIETLREANADLKRRLRKYNSTVGAATRLLIWKPHSLPPCPPTLRLLPKLATSWPFGNSSLTDWGIIPLGFAWARRNARCSRP
jgi:hypothetical protein